MTDTTIDLDVLIKLFDTNLRILKEISTDHDAHMAGRIEELESTIRTLESLRTIVSASNRIAEELDNTPEPMTVPGFSLDHEKNGSTWLLNIHDTYGLGDVVNLRLYRYQLRNLRRMIDDELERHSCRADERPVNATADGRIPRTQRRDPRLLEVTWNQSRPPMEEIRPRRQIRAGRRTPVVRTPLPDPHLDQARGLHPHQEHQTENTMNEPEDFDSLHRQPKHEEMEIGEITIERTPEHDIFDINGHVKTFKLRIGNEQNQSSIILTDNDLIDLHMQVMSQLVHMDEEAA